MQTYRGTPKKLSSILYDLDADKVYELKEYKEKRNNKQNSRYWVMLSELSLVLKKGIEELHFEMLKNYSKRYEICVPSDYEVRGIEYYEKKSTLRRGDREFSTYYVFVPSHELNIEEFAILMQGLIDECQSVGIDTRSPDEIKRDEGLYDISY